MTSSTENNTSVAMIIDQQMGGAMKDLLIGTYHKYAIKDGLQFKFRGSPVANFVEIKLQENDLYTMSFKKIRGFTALQGETFSDLYDENLVSTFEETTKLFLSLHPSKQ